MPRLSLTPKSACQKICWPTQHASDANYQHAPSALPLSKGTTLQASFCVFTSVWSVGYCKMWRREQAAISAKWGTLDFERFAPTRPQYHGSNLSAWVLALCSLFGVCKSWQKFEGLTAEDDDGDEEAELGNEVQRELRREARKGLRPWPVTNAMDFHFPSFERRCYRAFSVLVLSVAISLVVLIFKTIIGFRLKYADDSARGDDDDQKTYYAWAGLA